MTAQPLRQGHRIHTREGALAGSVERFLGAGGQGEVYEISGPSGPLAFKRYHPAVVQGDARLSKRLTKAIANGPPDARFLWPLAFAGAEGDEGGVGILMPMREARFRSMKDLIAAPPRRVTPSLPARATACLRIADSFLHLHACGLCYQDISFGNLFLDPATGDIAICDNDNVDVNGAPPSVYGTRKFMAPEIVRREAMPAAQTDLYSMAVLFFYILFAWHPLDGRAEAEAMVLDADAELALYGTKPRFLFDPEDASNGPVPGMHDAIVRRWRALSPELRRLFLRAFTAGLSKPEERVVETEWRDAFLRLRDTVTACPGCGLEHALSADDADPMPARLACIACQSEIALPLVLTIGRARIALRAGARLTMAHLEAGQRFNEAAAEIGLVEPHPSDPHVLGLRNLGGAQWRASYADGRSADVPPGRAMRIADGATITFGTASGRIGPTHEEARP